MFNSAKLRRKLFSILSLFSFTFNIFQPALIALTQIPVAAAEEEVATTPLPTPTLSPTPAPSVEPTTDPSPSLDIILSPSPSPSLSPEPTIEPSVAPDPSPTNTPAPSDSSPAPPSAAEALAEDSSPAPNLDEQLNIIIVDNTAASSIEEFDLTITETGSATLSTDKVDYSPTDTALITGAGFLANTSYSLTISSSDDPATSTTITVTSDADGTIFYAYQLDGIYRPNYKVEAFLASTLVASTTFTDSDPKITAKTHQGQESVGTWTSGNVTTYKEGDTINFRFNVKIEHAPASGQLEIRFSEDDGTCLFFQNYFVLGTIEHVSGTTPTVTLGSGPIVASGEWVVTLNISGPANGEGRVNYQLKLSDEAGQCNGSSQHSRLNPAGGDVEQSGQQNVPVPANQVIELPDITVIKMIDRDGNGSFESTANANEYAFTLDGTTTLNTNASGQVTFTNVTPDGAHSITENQLDFSLGSYSFASGTGTNCVFTGSTASATVAAGSTPTNASCTFNNQLSTGTLIVNKVVTNNNGGTKVVADFPLFVNAMSVVSGASNTLAPTTYTVTETNDPGYSATYSGDCNSQGQVTVVAGQTKTCTITNDDIAPTLTLVKNLSINYGGTASPTDWDLQATYGATGFHGVSPATGPVSAGLAYTLSESGGPSGYSAGSWSCNGGTLVGDQLTLGLGDNVSCQITNSDLPGTLIVKKVVVGGTKTASEFQFSYNQTGPIQFESDGQNDLTVPRGTYTVTEVADPDYATTYNNCSNVFIGNGDSSTCTVTNTRKTGRLFIDKILAGGGPATQSSWNFTVRSLTGAILGTLIDDGVHNFIDLNTGSYTVTESSNVLGYSIRNVSGVCGSLSGSTATATVGVGNNTCIFTNDRDMGFVQVHKQIDLNADGDYNDENEASNSYANTLGFRWQLDGGSSYQMGNSSPMTPTTIPGVSHSVTESPVTGYHYVGYTLTGDCDTGRIGTYPIPATINKNATTQITLCNARDSGTIRIYKDAYPNNDSQAFAFTGTTPIGSFTLDDNTNPTYSNTRSYALPIGSYSITENAYPAWGTLTNLACTGDNNGSVNLASRTATINLDKDEIVTCTYTNKKHATLTLNKTISGGSATLADFTPKIDSTTVSWGTPTIVSYATHTASEVMGVSGYTASDWGGDCNSAGRVTLNPGDNKTCTITNTRDTGSITIVKDAINNSSKNFSFVTTGGGSVPATIYLDDDNDPTLPNSQTYLTPTGAYTFTEEQVDGWKLTDLTCIGDNNGTVDISSRQATINLDKNETVTCTFVNTQLGSIQGRKYNDVNGNGDFDSNEKINANRLNGWTINLYKDNTIIKSMSTGDDNTEAGSVEKGQYRFINLLPGTYDICEVPQNGWHQTEPANGVQHSEQTNCHTVNLSAGQNLDTIQFGNFQLGRIYGYKYEDHNGNGAWDQGESGLSNWTIKLGSTTTTTNTDGYFEFANLLAGNYVLSEDETNPDFARTQPTAGSYNIAISSGTGYNQESDYLFGNAPLTDIHGYKWNDVNGNGERDCTRFEGLLRFEINQECEDLLGDWTIFLDENGNELLDEGETSTTTDNNPESKDYGWYIFRDLMPGDYTICEVKKDGWQQTYPLGEETICHHIVVPNDNEQTENGIVGPEYDFGNQAEPVLRIQKTNDATGNKNSGDIITYTLTLDLAGSDLSEVTVTDVTPQGFSYVAGSYTSSQSGVSEPNYGSPGTWNIGDMTAGQTITLTYQAKISSDQDGGTYSDIAWGQGSSSAWGTVLAQGHDSTYLDALYVGTDVTIVKNMDQTGSVNIERTGEVLGASTELPATGSNTGWLILAIGLLLLGLTLIFGGKMKVILVVLFSLSPFLMSRPFIAHAADPDNQLSVRIEQPQTPTRSNDWKLGFSVLDRSFGTPTVTCYVKKPSSGSYVSFGATHTSAKPEGDNGSCLVDSSVVSEQGTYNFYVTAVSGSLSENSATVSLVYDTEGPDRPVYYHKENIGYCHNKISFRSADDGGRTSSIQIFGSTNTTFNTDAGTRLGSVTLGSNQEGSFTHNQVGEDCNKTWYYVIRAYDSVGNSSAHLGDEIVTITTITPSASPFGAIPVVTGTGSVLGQEASATATNTTTPDPEQTSNVEGSGLVAGIKDVVNTATSNPKIWYYLAGVVLLILGIYVYSRRR